MNTHRNHSSAQSSTKSLSLRTSIVALALSMSVVAVGGCDQAQAGEPDFDVADRVGVTETEIVALDAEELQAELQEPRFYPGVYSEEELDQLILELDEQGIESAQLNLSLAAPTGDSGPLMSVGSQPIHIQKYGPFGNGGTLSTGFPTGSWIATVVGIDTTDGDINENGTGNPLRAFPFQSGGIWNVTFDLRSHINNESWSIWVMYVNRSMATSTNF